MKRGAASRTAFPINGWWHRLVCAPVIVADDAVSILTPLTIYSSPDYYSVLISHLISSHRRTDLKSQILMGICRACEL